MKKVIGIFVCMLLICTIIPLSTIADDPIRKTITVDDDVGADYTNIQDAINNANDGDTVYVYSGTYNENIIVDVSIDLIGEDKETTVIDSINEGNTIKVAAEYVTISSFNIQHNGDSAYGDNGIKILSDNSLITDNIIKFHVGYGVLVSSSFNTVSENTISKVRVGVMIHYTRNNIISDNIITNPDSVSIYLNLWCNNNTVCNNYVTGGAMSGIQITQDSVDNYVFNNHVYKNQYGMYLHTCSNNFIYENIIEQNWLAGINTNLNSKNNLIYNNNFLNNADSAQDYTENDSWDSGYPIGGNYWSDYEGVDDDGDGIGDTPYVKDYNDNNPDRYPLIEPFGSLRINPSGPYYGFRDDKIQFNGFACGGTLPYEWYWDFGDGTTSDLQNPLHEYTEKGEFTVKLKVTDDVGTKEYMYTYAWVQDSNYRPDAPTISGPTKIWPYRTYIYTFSATDPDNTPVYYYVDWGDGEHVEWFGPFDAGKPQSISHSWEESGEFIISVQAKDIFGLESDWETLEITSPRDRSITISLQLFELFQKIFPRLSNIFNIGR